MHNGASLPHGHRSARPLIFRCRGRLEAKSFVRAPESTLLGPREGSSILNVDLVVMTAAVRLRTSNWTYLGRARTRELLSLSLVLLVCAVCPTVRHSPGTNPAFQFFLCLSRFLILFLPPPTPPSGVLQDIGGIGPMPARIRGVRNSFFILCFGPEPS